jgi:transcriptional regulator with XRE-family HTH domain
MSMKKKTTIDNFGGNLSCLRKARGLTQKKLGEMIGVSNRVIAYYEKETNYPPAHLIAPLSEALGVSTDELLGIKKSTSSITTGNVALWRKLRVVENLPKKDQKAILHYINIVAKHRQATA